MNASRKGREGRKEGKDFANKTARLVFRKTVHHSLYSVFKMALAKIDQQTKAPIAQAKLCEHLLTMHPGEFFHRFQLHYDFILDQEAGPKALIENQLVVRNTNRHLPFNSKTLLSQFVRKGNLVYSFQESGSRLCMDLVCCIKNYFRKLIFCKLILRIWVHNRREFPPRVAESMHISWADALQVMFPLRPSRPLREACPA